MLEARVRSLTPSSQDEVLAIVAEANAHGRKLEVMGAGSKRSLGAVEGADAMLSTARLDRIIDYQPDELVLTVQPGVRVADLERLVAGRGQMLAFESPHLTRLLGARGEPTLGGEPVG